MNADLIRRIPVNKAAILTSYIQLAKKEPGKENFFGAGSSYLV